MGKKKKKDEETGLEDGSVLSRPAQLSAAEIQAQEFRLAFRGYNEKDVDAFLDHVTEEYSRIFEENQRLRGGAPLDGGASVADAARAAEEIKRKAREEAAAILANAQTQTGGVIPGAAAAGSSQHMSKFISGEREFLQSLASLIQQHAESVKSTARDAQHAQASAAAAAAAALPTTREVSAEETQDTEGSAGEAANEPAGEQASGSNAAAQTFSTPPPATGAADSAWTATASPAAAPATSSEPAIENSDGPSDPTESAGASGAVARSIDSVISIPPSPVDTPMHEAVRDSSSESVQVESSSGVSVDVDQREFDDEPGEPVRLPDSPMAESNEARADAPNEERSLRDLFWGDE